MHLVKIEFLPGGKTVEIEKGSVLRAALEKAHLGLRMPCGGKGRCGKCKVLFQTGAPAPTPAEVDRLTETELAEGYRLGCLAVPNHSAIIHIPNGAKSAKILAHGTSRQVDIKPNILKKHAIVDSPSVEDLRSDLSRVLDALQAGETPALPANLSLPMLKLLGSSIRDARFDVTGVFSGGDLIAIESGDTTAECYGIAIDIGTTTLAAYLMDLCSGKQVAAASAINPQTMVGDDVVSRIAYSGEADGLTKLQTSVVSELNSLIAGLVEDTGISLDRIYEATIVGNTCMTHLFLGIDPVNLAQAPYVPVVSRNICVHAGEVGLNIHPCGQVFVLPNIAGYVGADTVGVISATGLYLDDKITLAVDIGTNGEIVLGSRNRLLACSTAAGPAFEGAHIEFGMRAADGAIDGVWLDEGKLGFSTVGNEKAVGICGSGLLDAVVCMVEAGIVESTGRIVDPEEVPAKFADLKDRLREGERGNEFILVRAEESGIGQPIVITQRDVREVQLAKGAISAGIHSLMDRLGVTLDQIDRVLLAGAFGNYVKKESAVAAGMLPDVPLAKVHSVGNAAGEGAKLALISTDVRSQAQSISEEVEYVELTTDPGFQERFAEALMFGETTFSLSG